MRKIFLLAFFSILFISCSKSSTKYADFAEEAYAYEDTGSFVQTSAKQLNMVASREAWSDSNYIEGTSDNNIGPQEIFERKLIKNGYIQLNVTSLDETDSKIEAWTKKYGGYISTSNLFDSGCRYTVQIPAEMFDEAMNSVAEFGKVRNRTVNVRDVTDQFYDLQGRLETKKILQEKYNQYLKKADNMKDLLEVERELNDVISEIESMEGQMKRLNHQISYSTIELSLTAVSTPRTIDSYIETIKWKKLFSNIINLFIKLFVVIIYIIVFGIPFIAVIALLYWLLFGKIGLLKKLFKRLRGKKNE